MVSRKTMVVGGGGVGGSWCDGGNDNGEEGGEGGGEEKEEKEGEKEKRIWRWRKFNRDIYQQILLTKKIHL